MKKFAFKLDPLLKLRANQRDLCQQLLADVLRRDDELVYQRSETEKDRRTQIDELRSLGGGGRRQRRRQCFAAILRRATLGKHRPHRGRAHDPETAN